MGASDITSPDRATQSVRYIVGYLYGLFLGFEGYNADHRAEDFVAGNCHSLANVS